MFFTLHKPILNGKNEQFYACAVLSCQGKIPYPYSKVNAFSIAALSNAEYVQLSFGVSTSFRTRLK